MVAAVSENVDHADDSPSLQLAQAGADIGAGDRESLGDLLGVERLLRNKKERMDLGHGAIDSPTRAHFAPVQDEFLLDLRELHFLNFCINRNYRNNSTEVKPGESLCITGKSESG